MITLLKLIFKNNSKFRKDFKEEAIEEKELNYNEEVSLFMKNTFEKKIS
jgi:hypothetical protein